MTGSMHGKRGHNTPAPEAAKKAPKKVKAAKKAKPIKE